MIRAFWSLFDEDPLTSLFWRVMLVAIAASTLWAAWLLRWWL